MSKLSDDLRTLSYEAALYFYPLVLMDISRLQALNAAPGSGPMAGPPNQFHHLRAFPSADFRAVVRPNFDTLYSSAWLDLTAGPVIVHAPDTEDRYYMLPMLDMWTDVFANPGKRTTGTGAQDFVVMSPDHAGEVPPDLPVISAPTPYVWIIGRTANQRAGRLPERAPGPRRIRHHAGFAGSGVRAAGRIRHDHRAAACGQWHGSTRLLQLRCPAAGDQSSAPDGFLHPCPHFGLGHWRRKAFHAQTTSMPGSVARSRPGGRPQAKPSLRRWPQSDPASTAGRS